MEGIPDIGLILEQYGTGGALVVLMGVLLRYLIPALKSLKVNPSLGEHLGKIHADLKTIASNTSVTQKRVEDIWERDAKPKARR